ncbi:MAG: RdgB/HAM1 family non-canonical purine NTP pyrophosphatase [bacterium]|nr:RdgB/HAM1 family non-canonical purine NTP pyrophosphatase [bacterium]
MDSLYFVTSNQGKLEEAKMILGMPIIFARVDLVEIQSLDLEEIAKDKTRRAFEFIQKPLFVDDVGLYIEAWNGFPGPFIKYLTDAVGNEGLLKMMENEINRNVIARLIIGFHDGKDIHAFIGETKGTLAKESRGENGFGWDSVFIPKGIDKTYAELSMEQKSTFSHRRIALENFRNYLRQK